MKGKWAESDTLLDINDISGQIIGRSGWMDGWMDGFTRMHLHRNPQI